MTKEQYLAQRNKLLNEANQLLNDGKAEEADAKMNEVEALDQKWDAIATAQANLTALSDKQPTPFQVTDHFEQAPTDGVTVDSPVLDLWASEDYMNAWYKDIVGQTMTDKESGIFKKVNEAYTHTTKNTGVVIPKTVVNKIWELAGEMYPFFEATTKTYVNGVFSMVQEDTSSDAAWVEEGVNTEDGKETLKEFTLSGCELSRVVSVSWKLKEMSMEDFIPYIERKLAKKMGKGAAYGATYGAGTVEGKAPEPTGVITALKAEKDKPQVVTYDGTPTYKNLLDARAKVKSGYSGGLKLYANSTTIWTMIANILDANKRPIFMTDPMTGGFRVLGAEVKEDDSFKDGDILFSNAASGYHININKDMTILPEEHVKARKTDYCGYAIMDGNAVTTKAHSLLTKAETTTGA